ATMAIRGDVVYLGGGFEAIDDIPHYFLAGVSKSGVVQDWHAWLNGWVNTLAFDGNTLYVGGYFYEAYGLFRNHVAAFDFTEQSPRLTDWAPDVNGLVNTLTLMDNSIAVGGYFTEVNQQPRLRFAALDKQGALTPLDAKLNGYNVYSLEAARNGIYIGGGFTQASGATRLNSVKLLPDGTLGQWYPGPRFEVHAIQQQEGWVYRGGYGFFEIVRDLSEGAPDT
ncbi:MAG TPA: hypothetical protein PK011_16015, partial [Marinagarivorans sp.]|nr:hypothetical protein [Marinagarivorans sp.]